MKRINTSLWVVILAFAVSPACDDSGVLLPPDQAQLTQNRIRWERLGPASYAYEFNWSCFCRDGFTDRVRITVEEGRITRVIKSGTGEPLPVDQHVRYRTIEGLFDFIQDAIDRDADQMGAAYDSKHGYPVSCQVDYERGLADEEMAFHVHEFVPGRN